MTKLKPCPFCGGNAVIRKNEERVKPFMVRCGNMGCGLLMVMTDYFATEEEAIEVWNRRADRQTGKWIVDGHHIQCNVCHVYMCDTDREGDSIPRSFCPNCGAKMEREQKYLGNKSDLVILDEVKYE